MTVNEFDGQAVLDFSTELNVGLLDSVVSLFFSGAGQQVCIQRKNIGLFYNAALANWAFSSATTCSTNFDAIPRASRRLEPSGHHS